MASPRAALRNRKGIHKKQAVESRITPSSSLHSTDVQRPLRNYMFCSNCSDRNADADRSRFRCMSVGKEVGFHACLSKSRFPPPMRSWAGQTHTVPTSVRIGGAFQLSCNALPARAGWLPQNYSILKPEKFASQCAARFSTRNVQRLQSKQDDLGGTASVEPTWHLPEPHWVQMMRHFLTAHSDGVHYPVPSDFLFGVQQAVEGGRSFESCSRLWQSHSSSSPLQRVKVWVDTWQIATVQCQQLSAILTSAKSKGYLWAVMGRPGASA